MWLQRHFPIRLVCWALVAIAAGAKADEAEMPTATPQQAAAIRNWISQLDADSFRDREAAVKELERLGEPTIPFLEAAAQEGAPEVCFRAADLLKRLRAGPQQESLEAFCSQPDAALDVEHGMWLISRILNPKVRKADLMRQLDEQAAKVREKLGEDAKPAAQDPQRAVAALQQVLFEDLKFASNEEDYTNPDNSSLERVLTTRKGLPILLAHVTVAVARRLEIPIVGLPVSGPYIVKYDGARAPAGFSQEDIFFDPYDRGKILTREDRVKRFPNYPPDKLIPPGTSRATLIRMLSNLTSHLDHHPEMAEQLEQARHFMERLEAHRPRDAADAP